MCFLKFRFFFFTLHKIVSPEKPDSVSILLVDNADSVVKEDVDFQLMCEITNVAPAGNLTVRWYIGNVNFTSNGNLQELVKLVVQRYTDMCLHK